ncbi:MAG: hypothetical protein IPN60_16820 [Saprospiraceae bacterium]|nr:hypothetical protein [Candidatus Opimibacter skivensis]
MSLLIILALINSGFLLVLFFAQKSFGLNYTENLVARQIVAYTLTILVLLLVGFLLLKMYTAIHWLALILNIILILFLAFYLIKKLVR